MGKKTLLYFGEHFNEDATGRMLKKKKGELVKINGNVGFVISRYFVSVHENFEDYFGNLGDGGYEIKRLGKQNSEYEVYDNVTNSLCHDSLGWFYLLKCREVYKIGISNDFDNRFYKYKTENPFNIDVIFKVKMYGNDVIERNFIEKFKHKLFKGNEWFNLDIDDINFIKKSCLIGEFDENYGCYFDGGRSVFDDDREHKNESLYFRSLREKEKVSKRLERKRSEYFF